MAWGLIAVTVAGAVLRLLVPVETTLTAWPYSRTVPLAQAVFDGPLLRGLSAAFGGSVYLTDVIFWTNWLLAALSPLCVFLHARHLLHDDRGAIAAAALLAVLPLHIRFSRSDVYFIQSIALSSFAFSLIYTVLADRSAAIRRVAAVALPIVAAAAFAVRQLNLLFAPLMLITALALVADGVPRARRAVVVALIVAAATLAAVVLFTTRPEQLATGLDLQTLRNAAVAFVQLRFNTLVNPWITPPVFTALAVAGAVVLWRRDGARRSLFLVSWLGVFFVAHAMVLPKEMTVQARYHLHLAVPFVLLAAPAVVAVVRWHRWTLIPLALYAAAVPAIHLDFERDTDFDTQREWRFAMGLREHVPAGCTVLEYAGDRSGGSRVRRIGQTNDTATSSGNRWTIVPLQAPSSNASPAPPASDPLSGEALAVLAKAPGCLFYFEGLACWMAQHRGHRDAGGPAVGLARACRAVHERAMLTVLDEVSFAPRFYDDNWITGLAEDEQVTLRLFRVEGTPPVRLPAGDPVR